MPLHDESEESKSDFLPLTAVIEQTEFHFWMDTLCVPVNDAARRKKTIKTMRTVYETAGKVLVLDSELFTSSVERPYEEVRC
jgi:Heterokaryon incompatibility protein (HET)